MKITKFRGKRKDNGKWVYGDLFSIRTKEGNVGFFIIVKNIAIADKAVPANFICFEHGVDCFCVEENTVGKSTGLQDSKGNDIYEGDILKDKDWEIFEDKYSFVVSFDEISPRFLCGRTDGRGSNFQLDATFAKRSVIIANIHDNPELIKV